MAHRRTIPVPAKKIQALRWTAHQSTFLALSAGSAALNAITAGTEPATAMRSRGQLYATLDGASVPAPLVLVSIGLILVPEGQDTTVIWDPFADNNAPWWFYSQFILGYEEGVTDVIAYGNSAYRETVDLKAMRRIRPDEEIQCVCTATTLGGAKAVNVSLTLRTLLGN